MTGYDDLSGAVGKSACLLTIERYSSSGSADGAIFYCVGDARYVSSHLYHAHALLRLLKKVLQSLVGHKDMSSMELYTRSFPLSCGTLTVPFTGDGRDVADITPVERLKTELWESYLAPDID